MLAAYPRIKAYNTEILYISPEGLPRTREYLARVKRPASFPVLLDADRTVVKAYKLEKPTGKMTEVTPALFLIDAKGVLRFKYISQDVYDRPPVEHIEEMLGVVTGRR